MRDPKEMLGYVPSISLNLNFSHVDNVKPEWPLAKKKSSKCQIYAVKLNIAV